MWAYRLVAPRIFERCEVPGPESGQLGEGEVLLRTLVGGVCGGDLPVYKGRDSVSIPDGRAGAANIPGYPLHEIVGEVVESRSPDVPPGERVVGWATRVNALAEFVVTPGTAVRIYDGTLRPEHAIALQTLACVLDSVSKFPLPSRHTRVAILGMGPIGLLFGHVLKTMGADHVLGVDIVDRGSEGRRFGFDEVCHSTTDRWSRTVPDSARPGLVIEAIGHQTSVLGDAIRACAPGGFVNNFGVPDEEISPLPLELMLRKNITLFAGFTTDHRTALAAAAEYLARFPELPRTYVTDVFGFPEVQAAFEAACSPRPGQIKVALAVEPSS